MSCRATESQSIGVSDAPLSSLGAKRPVVAPPLVFPHSPDDAVGAVSFVGAAGFSACLAFGELAVDVDAGFGVVALLGDAGDVEHAVDASVAAEVEPMPDRTVGALARRQR